MFFDENEEPVYEFGIDFRVGDKVYAPDGTCHIAGDLIAVTGNVATVRFFNESVDVPLSEVSPYDTT